MNYVKYRWRQILPCAVVFASFHFYFFLFIQNGNMEYLLYLDALLLIPGAMLLAADWWSIRRDRVRKQGLMEQKVVICRLLPRFENQEIAEHDVGVLQEQVDRQFQENCDLQDYIAKWCHEMKVPLSAALLMDEKIEDRKLRMALREQLEKINLQMNGMLLGCRLQSPLLDIQVKKVGLDECVRTSLHNNRFFLIQNRFELTVEVEPLTVYTDPEWLVYVLDQLIANVVKYGKKEPGAVGGFGSGEQEGRGWREYRQEKGQEGRDWREGDGQESDRKERDKQERDGQKRDIEKKDRRDACEIPILHIWSKQQEEEVQLFVEDHGQGICDSDIRRIFEKGFTGRNYHNGKYKSTGMGLYMVSRILNRLGHEIQVESEYGVYTRFCITLRHNPYFLG